MGLFDKIFKEGAKALEELTSEENKEKAANLFNNIKEKATDVINEVTSEENKQKAADFFNEIKEKANEALNDGKDENKDKVSSFLDKLTDKIDEVKKEQALNEQKKEEYYTADPEDTRTAREKILQVLADEFPNYIVRENVSPRTIGGTGRFMDYSIAVYDNEKPVLFIMLIGKTTTSHREYKWSRQEAEKNGYNFINFVNHFPNTIPYITDRLHKYL